MNMKSAILVVALVAALAFVCEADQNVPDPCETINAIMVKANDTDGHSLIAAWENEYKNSNPKTEGDQLVKETLQLFVQFLQFNEGDECKQKNLDLLHKVNDVVNKYGIMIAARQLYNLSGALHRKGISYVVACIGLMGASYVH